MFTQLIIHDVADGIGRAMVVVQGGIPRLTQAHDVADDNGDAMAMERIPKAVYQGWLRPA